MVTGRYTSDLHTWDNASPYTGQAPSFGHRMVEAGVKVTTIGKLHFRNTMDDTGFPDQRIAMHIRDGIGDMFGTIREPRIAKPSLGEYVRNAGPGESSYITYDNNITEHALEFLNNETGTDQPWMLYLGYTMPHLPLICPQEFWDLYEGKDLPMPVEYKKDEMPQTEVCRAHRHYMGLEDELDDETVRRAVRAYYGMCSFLDYQIEIVVKKLHELGLDKNTIILYTTDHGEMLGNHGMWYKNSMYEPSAGIPLFMAGPGIPAGKVVNTPVSLVDIYPTMLDFMGIEDKGRGDLPGQSLLEMAMSGQEDPDRAVYSEYFASACVTSGFMVRHRDYKYIYYVGCEPQLFNIKEDPNELTDLAQNPDYADVLTQMDKKLREFIDPEAADKQCRKEQAERLSLHGGKEEVFNNFDTFTFSPAPEK